MDHNSHLHASNHPHAIGQIHLPNHLPKTLPIRQNSIQAQSQSRRRDVELLHPGITDERNIDIEETVNDRGHIEENVFKSSTFYVAPIPSFSQLH